MGVRGKGESERRLGKGLATQALWGVWAWVREEEGMRGGGARERAPPCEALAGRFVRGHSKECSLPPPVGGAGARRGKGGKGKCVQ